MTGGSQMPKSPQFSNGLMEVLRKAIKDRHNVHCTYIRQETVHEASWLGKDTHTCEPFGLIAMPCIEAPLPG